MSLVVELVKSTFKVESEYKSDFEQVHSSDTISYFYVFENRLIELQIKFDSKETVSSVQIFVFENINVPDGFGISFIRHVLFTSELYHNLFLHRYSSFIKQFIYLDSKRNSKENNSLIKRFAEHIDLDFIELYKYLGT